MNLVIKKEPDKFANIALSMPLWRLRWRFDFRDKPSKCGVWNDASPNLKDKACLVNKSGLVRASIEGEFYKDYIVKTFFECSGEDFATFKWEGAVNVPGFNFKSPVKVAPRIIGLSLLTRDERITVYVNGRIEKRSLTQHESKFKIYEHSIGV